MHILQKPKKWKGMLSDLCNFWWAGTMVGWCFKDPRNCPKSSKKRQRTKGKEVAAIHNFINVPTWWCTFFLAGAYFLAKDAKIYVSFADSAGSYHCAQCTVNYRPNCASSTVATSMASSNSAHNTNARSTIVGSTGATSNVLQAPVLKAPFW